MLKPIFVIVFIIGGLVIPVNAQSASDFGYQLHPEKLLENTIGDLQIYEISNDIMVPKSIQNLKVISSNTDIIQILESQVDTGSFTKNIKIKAMKPGVATIALAAQGFSSKEITLQVFNNNNYPTQIMMKATPEKFSIDGQKYGYLGIELATTGGLPTVALEDTVIKIETPNIDIIQIRNSEIIIKEGEYFGITEFDIIGSGSAIIFADSEGMRKISQEVIVLEPEGPLRIELNVIPEIYNSYSGAKGYAIAQLVDSGGIPVIAEEDIYFELDVDNPDVSKNTSTDFDEIIFEENRLVIKKGEYTAFTKFSPRPNLADFTSTSVQEFNMFISVQDYQARGATFTVLHDEVGGLEGEGPAVTQMVPFLTTGKNELIGVTYFETDIVVSRESAGDTTNALVTVPVMATNDFEISVSSSSSKTVKPQNSIMIKGENVVLLFGDTGTSAPEGDIEYYITDNDGVKTITSTINGPIVDNVSLTVEPLIPIILTGNEFPLVGYLMEAEDGDEEEAATADEDEEEENPRLGPTLFIEDGILTFSANDLVNIEPIKVDQNQEYVVIYQTIEDVGSSTLNAQLGEITGSLSLESFTTDPTTSYLGFVNNMLVSEENLATIQLLDSVGNPVYVKKDTIIQLVSNDESVLKTPNQIIINEGEYYNTFKLAAVGGGTVELAILSEDFPLLKYDIEVFDVTPIIALDLGGTMNWNERIEAKLSVTIPEIKSSLSGYQVEWITEGGEVRTMDTITNNDGIATLNIIANDKSRVSITAIVSGGGVTLETLSESVDIQNMPAEGEGLATNAPSQTGLPIDPTTLILIIIPVAIGGVIFFLKRTDRLDLITEKIPIGDNIGDKIEGIKERISDIRNR